MVLLRHTRVTRLLENYSINSPNSSRFSRNKFSRKWRALGCKSNWWREGDRAIFYRNAAAVWSDLVSIGLIFVLYCRYSDNGIISSPSILISLPHSHGNISREYFYSTTSLCSWRLCLWFDWRTIRSYYRFSFGSVPVYILLGSFIARCKHWKTMLPHSL